MALVWQPDASIGVDIRMNQGDLGVTSGGDLDIIGNITPAENVWQAVILRLLTTIGTYQFESDYGTNLRQYVDEEMTDQRQQQIKNEVNRTVLSDPRVKKIKNLTVSKSDSSPQGYQIALSILTVSDQSVGGIVTIGG